MIQYLRPERKAKLEVRFAEVKVKLPQGKKELGEFII